MSYIGNNDQLSSLLNLTSMQGKNEVEYFKSFSSQVPHLTQYVKEINNLPSTFMLFSLYDKMTIMLTFFKCSVFQNFDQADPEFKKTIVYADSLKNFNELCLVLEQFMTNLKNIAINTNFNNAGVAPPLSNCDKFHGNVPPVVPFKPSNQ